MPEDDKQQSYAPIWITVLVLVLVGIAVWAYAASRPAENKGVGMETEQSVVTENITSEMPVMGTPSGAVTEMEVMVDMGAGMNQGSATKEFTVTAQPFSFGLSSITVKKGDKVKITLDNKQGLHDLVIDEYNVHTPQLTVGKQASIEFVADKSGTFEYYCSVNNHRAMGMVGKLIVE